MVRPSSREVRVSGLPPGSFGVENTPTLIPVSARLPATVSPFIHIGERATISALCTGRGWSFDGTLMGQGWDRDRGSGPCSYTRMTEWVTHWTTNPGFWGSVYERGQGSWHGVAKCELWRELSRTIPPALALPLRLPQTDQPALRAVRADRPRTASPPGWRGKDGSATPAPRSVCRHLDKDHARTQPGHGLPLIQPLAVLHLRARVPMHRPHDGQHSRHDRQGGTCPGGCTTRRRVARHHDLGGWAAGRLDAWTPGAWAPACGRRHERGSAAKAPTHHEPATGVHPCSSVRALYTAKKKMRR